jgi:uncharacterized membrane protein YbaN (DUF454 family)
MPPAPLRWLLQAITGLCLVAAVAVPLVPSMPLLVAAAWAAARSSPRLHEWLLAHKRVGPWLRDWHDAGVVPRHAKWFTTVMTGSSAATMQVFVPPHWALAMLVPTTGMVAVLVWLWLRPEQRPDAGEERR